MWKMSDHEDDQVLGDDQENEDEVGGEGGAEEVEEVCSLLTFNLAGSAVIVYIALIIAH